MPLPAPDPRRPSRRRLLASLCAVAVVPPLARAQAPEGQSGPSDAALLDEGAALAYRRALAAAKPSTDTEANRRLRGIALRVLATEERLTGTRAGTAPVVTVVTGEPPDLRVYPGARILATSSFMSRLGLKDEDVAAILAQLVSLRLADDARLAKETAGAEAARPADPNRRVVAIADAVEHAMQTRTRTPEETAAADAQSVQAAAKAGYDPRAAARAWRALAGVAGLPLVRAQPVTPERLAALESAGQAAVPEWEQAVRAPRRKPPPGLGRSSR